MDSGGGDYNWGFNFKLQRTQIIIRTHILQKIKNCSLRLFCVKCNIHEKTVTF